MANVLIEFYSDRTPENLISILNESYDSVIFLYAAERSAPSPRKKAALSELVKKLFGFPAEFLEIPSLSVAGALEALNSLWKKGNLYQVDITGGDEAFLAAAGVFCQEKKEGVTLHQYHVPSGRKLYAYPENAHAPVAFCHYVSVPELLSLNGSTPLSAPSYRLSSGPLKDEILRLWAAVKKHPKDWNRYCALSDDDTEKRHKLTQKRLEPGSPVYPSIAAKLKKVGIISDEKKVRSGGKDYMEFSLNVPDEAKFLYDKAGNLLEMYCALCAHESGLFHDIRVGVLLDWNGRITGHRSPDPRNEVDLFLMRENLPIVVSCKNTAPQNEHLYEIMIMAKHYGGYFATPALFTSGKATETVRKRASEMGVVLIDSIRYQTQNETVRLMENHFGSPKLH